MTKTDIIECVREKIGGFSKDEAAETVETVLLLMKQALARRQKIMISGFGNFVVRTKNQRLGRNPQTGQPIVIAERKVVNFKPSQVLKATLNPNQL